MTALRAHAHTLLLLGLAGLAAFFHGHQMQAAKNAAKRLPRHEELLAGLGESPWVYRQLTPWLAEAVARVAGAAGLPWDSAVDLGYVVVHFLALSATLLLMHRVWTEWLGEARATAATLWFAALQAPSAANYWFQPDSPLDLTMWAAAIALTRWRLDGWLFPLVLVGSFNRETAVFAVALHAGLRWGEEPMARLGARCAGLVGVWAAVFVGLRALIPASGEALDEGALANLANNLAQGGWWLWVVAFVGFAPVLGWLGWADTPAPLRRLTWVSLPYLALFLLFGRVREVRLLLPMALVWAPVVIAALPRASASSGDAPRQG